MTLVETMTPRERVMNALAGLPVDRTPVANPTNVATVELMDMVDAPFPEACRDPELAARLAATGHTELGFDAIMPYFTIIQESSALGCEMQWEEKDNWPTVRMANPIWKTEDDIHIPSGFLEHPDNITITRSISLLKEEFGNDVAIIGKTMGPWTLAYHVFGVETFLLMTVDDPEMTMRCLDRLKEISVLFGQAQIDAGADALTFPDHATGDLVSGEYYRRFLLEIHKEMEDRLDVPLICTSAGIRWTGCHTSQRRGWQLSTSTPRTTRKRRWMRWTAAFSLWGTSTTRRRCTHGGPRRCAKRSGSAWMRVCSSWRRSARYLWRRSWRICWRFRGL